jgi:hypothetical protein
MSFKANGALFKNTPEKLQQRLGDRFNPNANYPLFDGNFSIKEEDRLAFATYVMNAPVNDRGEIPVKMSGWAKQANSGQSYLSLSIEPDYKTQKAMEEQSATNNAAQSLAKATDGTVLQDDMF